MERPEQMTHHESLRHSFDRHNISWRTTPWSGRSTSETAIHSPNTTPMLLKTLKYIFTGSKNIIKNLSYGRSTDDVLRIGHQVGGGDRAHPLGHHDLASSVDVIALLVGHPQARSAGRSVGMQHLYHPHPIHRLALLLGHLHCTSGSLQLIMGATASLRPLMRIQTSQLLPTSSTRRQGLAYGS